MRGWTLVSGDFVTTGGMDRANYALAAYLARTGESLELVTHRVTPDLAAMPGVTVRIVRKPLGSYLLGRWPLALAGRQSGSARHAANGRVVVNGGNCSFPDVNWVHYVHSAYRPNSVASWPRWLKSRLERPWDLHAERISIQTARIVVCNSNRTRRDVVERLGVDPDRAITVYYGSDAARFYPATLTERAEVREKLGWPTDRPIVIFIGALGDRRKGFDTLFDAWHQLTRSGSWDAILVVVGQGAETPHWKRLVEEGGMTNHVRFMGFRSDVPDLLRAADALVSPTRYEAYGLGVHEAICCGLPALVSADAGVAERYPADLAELLLPNQITAEELASRLRHWQNHSREWSRRIREFSETLRGHSWDDMARKFLAAAEKVGL